MSDLITLEQHNAAVSKRAEESLSWLNRDTSSMFDPARLLPEKPNGISCPNCEAELWDSAEHPDSGSYSIFYRKTHCRVCDYAGWRKDGW